jgi:hypothetical protein
MAARPPSGGGRSPSPGSFDPAGTSVLRDDAPVDGGGVSDPGAIGTSAHPAVFEKRRTTTAITAIVARRTRVSTPASTGRRARKKMKVQPRFRAPLAA